MSLLAGILHLDAAPVPEISGTQALMALGASSNDIVLSHRAPGLFMLRASSRVQNTDAALVSSISGNTCAWDGRLDNREELLTLTGYPPSDWRSDSHLALAMYEAEGVNGLRKLIGDWSLVIWDATTRSLLLASDYAGVRPLYYHRAGNRLIWSSTLQGLVQWAAVEALDEEYVAEFLNRGQSAGRTPYREIFPVPPGRVVRAVGHKLTIEAFWRLPLSETCLADTDEYEQQLLTLFRDAVRVRLRARTPVCAELSGGLDSSSIVCMAGQLISDGSVGPSELITFSYRYEGSTDEKFYQAVAKRCSLQSIRLDTATHPFVTPCSVGRGSPAFWEPRLAEIAHQMGALGSETFITGQIGDLIMGNWRDDSEQVADFLLRREFSKALREAFAWSESLQVPIYGILWQALRGSLFSWDYSANSDFAGIVAGNASYGDSIAPAFRKRVSALNYTPSKAAWLREVSPGRRKRLWSLSELVETRSLQCPETLQHVNYTHPFSHRPLVEFMMTIPAAVVCRPGLPRRLMRRAFTGLLPEPVLQRRSKGNYSRVFRKALLPLATEVLKTYSQSRLVEHGYVHPTSFRTRLERFTKGEECNEGQLRYPILLEFWLRKRDTRGSMV